MEQTPVLKKISFFRMLVISLLGFALTFSSNIQDPPLMTYKVRQLAPDFPNTALGILGFLGLLVAMVVQPLVGVFSDRARTKWGRRLPFLIGGVVLIGVSLFLLATAPTLWLLLVGVILIQFSSNILQGPWQALIPDLVAESQRGKASSLKAVMDILALVVGGMVAGWILGEAGVARWGENVVYVAAAAPVVLFALFVTFTGIWAREQPGAESQQVTSQSLKQALANAFSVDADTDPGSKKQTSGNQIIFKAAAVTLIAALVVYIVGFINLLSQMQTGGSSTLKMPTYLNITAGVIGVGLFVMIVQLLRNMRTRPQFRWWFINRILFWGAFIAVNSFLINYCVDVLKMTEEGAQSFYGRLKMILGVALIILALLAGWLSDKFGRKPVMIAAGLISFTGAFLLLFVRSNTLVTVAGGIVGMGIGTFLSASWALATDIVPRAEAARYLGIANIATCLGSGLARLLGGVLIDPINRALGSSSTGYLLLFALAAMAFLVSALVILPLPNKKKI